MKEKLTVAEIQEGLSALHKDTRHLIIFNMLYDGSLKYEELSKMYVEVLQAKKDRDRSLIVDLATTLLQHRKPKSIYAKNATERKQFLDERAIDCLKRADCFPEKAYNDKLK